MSSSEKDSSSGSTSSSNASSNNILAKKRNQVQQRLANLKTQQQQWKSLTPEERQQVVTQKKQALGQGLRQVGAKIQKFNIAKLIGEMETDQDLAYQLEELNEHLQEEKERRDIMREAEDACLLTMVEHLQEFLIANTIFNNPTTATYEQWIEDLHPENTAEGQLLKDMSKEIDLRFYVQESDHRIMWNKHVPERPVAARTSMWQSNEPVDLLTDMEEIAIADDAPIPPAAITASAAPPPSTVDEGDLISFDWDEQTEVSSESILNLIWKEAIKHLKRKDGRRHEMAVEVDCIIRMVYN